MIVKLDDFGEDLVRRLTEFGWSDVGRHSAASGSKHHRKHGNGRLHQVSLDSSSSH
jgi:hypothetical protein